MLSNLGFVILSVLIPEYQSLYAKYEIPKLVMAKITIGTGVNSSNIFITVIPKVAPKAP